ncbi:hypothetical protein FRC17_000401 [Serendipita sp. 399]|nr:hypothetical protein FRC17_000401 [Serendipita sp. 399]
MEENDIFDMATKIQATDNLDSKLDYLEQLKTSCKSLKRRLKRRRRRELRNTAKIDWINTLPTELLFYIIDLHRNSENVRRNADLMLVCRRWRTLIESAPQLWSRIEIKPHSSIDNIDGCTLIADFCIPKSGKRPLDITLDLTELWDPQSEPKSHLQPYLPANPEWFHNELKEIEQKIYECTADTLEWSISGLLAALSKQEGRAESSSATMFDLDQRNNTIAYPTDRLRSLRIFYSEWMLIDAILSQIHRPMPKLEILVIKPLWNSSYWSDDAESSIYDPSLSLPNLKILDTNAPLDISRLEIDQHTLQSMAVAIIPTAFQQLPKYSNLSRLKLILDNPSHIPTGCITLSQLENLSLCGEFSNSLVTMINAPRLQQIHLRHNSTLEFPTAELFESIHELDWDIYLSSWEKNLSKRSLSSVLYLTKN